LSRKKKKKKHKAAKKHQKTAHRRPKTGRGNGESATPSDKDVPNGRRGKKDGTKKASADERTRWEGGGNKPGFKKKVLGGKKDKTDAFQLPKCKERPPGSRNLPGKGAPGANIGGNVGLSRTGT